MRYLFFLLLSTGVASAQYRQPPVLVDDRFPHYDDASKQAVKIGRPLVTFVGVMPRSVEGGVVGRVRYFVDYPAQCIVVAVPDGTGWIEWRATLPITATDAQIKATFSQGVNRSTAQPFRFPQSSRGCST